MSAVAMQASFFSVAVDRSVRFDAAWRARCHIAKVDRSTVDDVIRRRHYLRCWPGVTVCTLAMICDMAVVGACVFALPPRETMTRYGGCTWELARLWIDDAIPSNAETWFIGKAVKHVRRNRRDVGFLVSYADPSAGHTGGIYRAANWRADGMTDDERITPRFDYLGGDGRRYQRRGHIPEGMQVIRIPRVSKYRFVLPLTA